MLVFLADYQRWYDVLESYEMTIPPMGEGDLFLAMQDCMIAAQNAVVAAESMGIGSCYIGDILENYEENQKLLNLPKYVLPISMLVLGRPTKQQKNRTKPERFKVEDLVFTDTYRIKIQKKQESHLKRKLSVNDEELKERLERYKKRKFEAEFHYEMESFIKGNDRELEEIINMKMTEGFFGSSVISMQKQNLSSRFDNSGIHIFPLGQGGYCTKNIYDRNYLP